MMKPKEATLRPCLRCKRKFRAKYAGRCPECRGAAHRARMANYWATHKKYVWTPERDAILKAQYDGRIPNRAAQIAARLGWPKWVITRRAQLLGLSHPYPDHRAWTPAEERILEEHAGQRTVQWISKRLPGRTFTAVVLKLKRMHLSRRFREGYTLRDLELCFGVDHHSIDKWIREGKLTGRRRGTNRHGAGGRPLGVGSGPADPWVFTDEGVLRFIKEHPTAFRLDKVDQVWFMDLLLGSGLLRLALDRAAKDKDVA